MSVKYQEIDEDWVNMSDVYCDSAPPDQGRDKEGALEEIRLWVQALSSGGDTTAIITQEQAQQKTRYDRIVWHFSYL